MSDPLTIGDFVQLSGDKKVWVINSDPDGFEVSVFNHKDGQKTVKRWEIKRCSAFGEPPDTKYPAWILGVNSGGKE